jgi:hypothetical protein
MYRRDRYLLRMDAIDLASTCCTQNPFFSSGWAKTVQSRSEPRFRSDLGFHPWLFDVHDSFGLARGIAVDKAAIAMNWKRIIHREHVLVRDGELPIFSSVHMARPREHFAGLAPAKSRCERIQNTYDGNCKARDTIFGGKTSHCVVAGGPAYSPGPATRGGVSAGRRPATTRPLLDCRSIPASGQNGRANFAVPADYSRICLSIGGPWIFRISHANKCAWKTNGGTKKTTNQVPIRGVRYCSEFYICFGYKHWNKRGQVLAQMVSFKSGA